MVLLIHFGLVFVFASPVGNIKGKASYISAAYVYPYFQQNWNLFTPNPVSNYTLFARAENDSLTADVFKEILVKHQTNRLAGYEALVIAFTNTIHYFEKNTRLTASLNGPVKGDPYFTMLEHSTRNYLQNTRQKKISPVKLVLLVEDVHTGEHRIYFN